MDADSLNACPRLHPTVAPEIIFETDSWMVVNKPALMAAHPSKPGDSRTLWHWLQDLLAYERVNGGQVSLINRLDRETSGLTLIAKSRGAARSLCRQMEHHQIEKKYLAVVHGWPTSETWSVNAPILRKGLVAHSAIWLKQAIHPDGASALTHFRVLKPFQKKIHSTVHQFSLVEACPVTGRMHQIRVHLAHSAHPIVGDKIYGEDETCYLDFIESGWTPAMEKRLILPRHALHAHSLRLRQSQLHWQIAAPDDFQMLLSGAE